MISTRNSSFPHHISVSFPSPRAPIMLPLFLFCTTKAKPPVPFSEFPFLIGLPTMIQSEVSLSFVGDGLTPSLLQSNFSSSPVILKHELIVEIARSDNFNHVKVYVPPFPGLDALAGDPPLLAATLRVGVPARPFAIINCYFQFCENTTFRYTAKSSSTICFPSLYGSGKLPRVKYLSFIVCNVFFRIFRLKFC